MSKILSLRSKDLVKILQQKGFLLDRSNGSHQIWLHPVSGKRAILPFHGNDLPTGTLYAILKQAGIDTNDL